MGLFELDRRFRRAVALPLALSLSLTGGLVASAQESGSQTDSDQNESNTEQVTARDFVTRTSEYVGDNITVTGQVGAELDREAFTISVGSDEILVIGNRSTIPQNLADRVRVQGMVQESFNVGDVENELDIQLNDSELSEFEGDPFVMAQQVEDNVRTTAVGSQQDQEAEQVRLRDIVANPGDYENQRVQVSGSIEDVPLPHGYMISTENGQVLVIGSSDAVPTNADGTVQLTGTVQLITVDDLNQTFGFEIPSSLSGDAFPIPAIVVDAEANASAGDMNMTGQEVQLNELFQNTRQYTGDQVSVSGNVGAELDREAFTLTVDGQELLVVGERTTIPRDVPNQVMVQGTVQESFNIQQVEEQARIRLSDNALSEFEGQAYIMASAVSEAQIDGDMNQDGMTDNDTGADDSDTDSTRDDDSTDDRNQQDDNARDNDDGSDQNRDNADDGPSSDDSNNEDGTSDDRNNSDDEPATD